MMRPLSMLFTAWCFTALGLVLEAPAQIQPPDILHVPYLAEAPSIDRILTDWKDNAYTLFYPQWE